MASKPWTPYAKTFLAACERLMEGIAPAPFQSMADAGVWIAERKFIHVISTDLEAESLIEAIVSRKLGDYHQVMNSPDIRWELKLRCQCAYAFCIGRLGKRGDFSWDRRPEVVYRELLIEFWRTEALRWAKKELGMSGYAEAKRLDDCLFHMKRRLVKTDPSRN